MIAALPCFALARATAAPAGDQPVASSPAPLAFSITEGAIDNHFVQDGPAAAHLLTTSGTAMRIIVAFPDGNTGVGVWFEPTAKTERLSLAPGTALEAVNGSDGMHGVKARLRSSAGALAIRVTLLANIRTIRDFIATGARTVPAEFVSMVESGPPIVFRRTTVDGHHVELRITPMAGGSASVTGPRVRLQAGVNGAAEFELTAATDYPALTPFAPDALFTPAAADRPRDREVFAFLVSREKFMAGSWRFLTYFGRDTLLTVQLLMPVLQPAVVEAALGSVLERLGPDGEVAHEEGIGEFAALENRRRQPPPHDLLTPVLDYKMVDGDFLLAPAAAAYLLDTSEGRIRAAAFLARRTSGGETYRDRLDRNLARVMAEAKPWADRPVPRNLISLKPGIPVGNWRDSNNGLGGGRYPFDINVALVPAALRAAARLYGSGLLGEAQPSAAEAQRLLAAWQDTEKLFRVTVPADEARRDIAEYARSLQLDPAPAIAAVQGPLTYDALSLDAQGAPVRVMHTDSGFVLFFTAPPAEYLDRVARWITEPFPAGLRTGAGIVVANPAFGGKSLQRMFTRADYHGTVVWSWQQALLAAGLKRQLARTDLPAATRERLSAAERALWELITKLQALSSGELWTWEPRNGTEVPVPFGQAAAHVDESNAAQLWSTVYLAVQPPTP